MEKKFKKGDKVFDIRYGWGEILNITNHSTYPIEVEFSNTIMDSYTKKGSNYLKNNPTLSHIEYSMNPNKERVVEVSNDNVNWKKRVYIKTVERRSTYHVTWLNAQTVEEAKNISEIRSWKYIREVQEEQIVELTLQDISDGKGVGIPSHLIRIKE